MLVPLTRAKFEQLIPIIATAAQYKYCWGKSANFLFRLLISLVSVAILFLIEQAFQDFAWLFVLIGTVSGFYWLWGPVFWASLRNLESRRYRYSAFWRGQVLDVYISEELVGKAQENVNKRGELVIVENRERRLNLEVGDETGFLTQLQVPLKRSHQAIVRGEWAEMLVMSERPDMSRIAKVSDIFLPELNLWVSDYPYLRRDLFVDISHQLGNAPEGDRQKKKKKRYERDPGYGANRSRRPPRRDDDW
ncbi:phosphate ABC transporter permease [Planktothrix sp. FACHB-1355]|uniref:Phosphate ABC transporter permease n=1 Tax=Aerosakkonema funiforme FACHB-1375 TaxID=2949571 RepID=A0A926VNR5_9CYAN|nr:MULTISPECIES: phosphate ABC transporter permease [Oscillatoriales]MBD2185849.1 phosphate ABC transporter permease [Aerosakkonema funiforme FACHB-1375]MBD3558539.1 phosphate ABC transporter permease [Planktothrix sp. FACHB-1355]